MTLKELCLGKIQHNTSLSTTLHIFKHGGGCMSRPDHGKLLFFYGRVGQGMTGGVLCFSMFSISMFKF